MYTFVTNEVIIIFKSRSKSTQKKMRAQYVRWKMKMIVIITTIVEFERKLQLNVLYANLSKLKSSRASPCAMQWKSGMSSIIKRQTIVRKRIYSGTLNQITNVYVIRIRNTLCCSVGASEFSFSVSVESRMSFQSNGEVKNEKHIEKISTFRRFISQVCKHLKIDRLIILSIQFNLNI